MIIVLLWDFSIPQRMFKNRTVLYLNRVGFLGGVERVLLTLAEGVAARGYYPLIACPGQGALAQAADAAAIEVIPFEFDRMRITANPLLMARYPHAVWVNAREVVREAVKRRIDLIHVFHPVGAIYAALAARWLRIPLVLHLHEAPPVKPLYAAALRLALTRADRVICVSKAALELASIVHADTTKMRIIPNGVDRQFLKQDFKPASEVTGPGPHIGVFGVLEPRKGQDIFLEAAALLARRFPTARFWLVGPSALADKVAFRDRLQASAIRLGIARRVTFTGFRPDVAQWMMAMDVVALTSVSHESFGMVLVEASALGRKIVASRSGGIPEVLTTGEISRLVPPKDPVALAEAIADLLNVTDQSHSIKAARETRARFSPELFCDRIVEVYDEVAADEGKT